MGSKPPRIDPDSTSRLILQRELEDLEQVKARFRARTTSWRAQHAHEYAALIVDDDNDVSRSLARALGDVIRHINIAHFGDEALHALRVAPYDLVIVDLNLPDITGMEVVTELRRESLRPLTRVLVVSGSTDLATIEQLARECGANAWLPKPVDPDALRKQVFELLRC